MKQDLLDAIVYPSDRMGRTEFAGNAAADVEANWHRPEYRNALMLSLGTYIENMIVAHQDEWKDLVKQASKATGAKARRSVIKAYLTEQISKTVTDDKGHVHDQSGKFTGPGGNQARSGGRARLHPLHDLPGKQMDLEQAARLGNTINAFAHYSTEGIQNQQMKFVVEDKKGNQRVFVSHDGKLPDMAKDEKVVSYKPLGIAQTQTIGGHSFNLLQALGAPTRGAAAGGGVADTVQAMAKSNGNHYAKVQAASELFVKLGAAGIVPPPVAAAGMVGMYAAKHGPEVVEVLGPHMRKFSYKYRGMEALPQQMSSVATRGKGAGAGVAPDESTEAFEFRLAGALASRNVKEGGLGAVAGRRENALLLATGGTAPSHGFLLNRDGKVTQQVVGVADDHYVPFNLKKLHDLDGGSYVRSRAFGGPTTEDLALAMRTGAKRLTTVSRHGVYTVEFETRANSIRGRYGDIPPLVINRYGRLLDGIKHGSISKPDNSGNLSLNGEGYNVALHALKAQFPLLIKSVKYHKASDVPGLKQGEAEASIQEDTGYVRPHYLKPGAAKHGYYDPKLGNGTPQSYDEIDGYRMAKANRYRAAAKLAAEEAAPAPTPPRRPTFGQGNRDVVQGDVKDGRNPLPDNLTGDQRRVGEAGGGTSSSEVLAQRERKPNPEHAAALLAFAKSIVHDAPDDDEDAKELRAYFYAEKQASLGQTHNKEDLEGHSALEDRLTNSAEARSRFRDTLGDIWSNHPAKQGLGYNPPEEEETEPEGESQPEALVDSVDAKDYKALTRYLGLAKNQADLQKQGRTLKPETMKELEGLHAYFHEPDPDPSWDEEKERPTRLHAWTGIEMPHLGGLTYKEHIENQIDKQEGRAGRHSLRAPIATVTEDSTPEETEKIANKYADETMSDIGLYREMYGDEDDHKDFFG